MRQQLSSALLAAVLSWTVSARAQDADALIDQGLDLREHGKDAEALAVFGRAFEKAPSPRAKAQIALAEQALGRWVVAEKDLSEALSAGNDPWIAKYKGALDEALVTVRTHLGDLIINGGVAGAEVKVDGVAATTLPVTGPLRLVVGMHTIDVRADGYYPFSQPVTIQADAPAAVSVDMHHLEVAPPPKVEAGPVPVTVTLPILPRPASHTQRVVGIVLAVSSVAPLALGFVGLGAREGEVTAYNGDATCPGLSASTQPANCQGHIDAAGAWQAVSIAGFITAGVLVVTGVIVALVAPRERRSISMSSSGVLLRW